jgi:hypothetical protein
VADPAILFVKPKAISAEDKNTLKEAGVIVIEIKNLSDAKFVRPYSELDGSELLRAAAKAISESNYTVSAKEAFGRALCAAITATGRVERV